MGNTDREKRYTEFLRLFRKHENSIFCFILRSLPNFSVAEDVMQETLLTLWEKFDEFEEGTNFAAWAKQVAHYKIFSYLNTNKRRAMVRFDHDTLEVLMEDDASTDIDSSLLEALHSCIDKLRGKSREVIQYRYIQSMKVRQIAELWHVSEKTLYRQMSRIHYHLQKCIENTLTAWKFPND